MKTVLDNQQQLLRLLHENQTTINHLGRLLSFNKRLSSHRNCVRCNHVWVQFLEIFVFIKIHNKNI